MRNPFKYVFICAHIFYVRLCDFEVVPDVCIHACCACVCVCMCVCVCVRCSVMSDSLRPTRPLCSWSSPGKNTGVSSYFLLQGIFLTQGLNPRLLHGRQILYHLSHQGSPQKKMRVIADFSLERMQTRRQWSSNFMYLN